MNFKKMGLSLLVFFLAQTAFAQSCQEEYRRVQEEVLTLAGDTRQVPLRIPQFKSIYAESQGLFHFPLLAAHGARWAYTSQKSTDLTVIALLAVFSGAQSILRWNDYQEFVETIYSVNRRVFVDTLTLYYLVEENYRNKSFFNDCKQMYSKKKLVLDLFEEYIDLLSKMFIAIHENRLHEFSPKKQKRLYRVALNFEQNSIVSQKVDLAFERFERKWRFGAMRARKVKAEFAYFPKKIKVRFHDFSDKQERIKWAMYAYKIAIQVGLNKVEQTLDL